jgi:hypothetical protein
MVSESNIIVIVSKWAQACRVAFGWQSGGSRVAEASKTCEVNGVKMVDVEAHAGEPSCVIAENHRIHARQDGGPA